MTALPKAVFSCFTKQLFGFCRTFRISVGAEKFGWDTIVAVTVRTRASVVVAGVENYPNRPSSGHDIKCAHFRWLPLSM